MKVILLEDVKALGKKGQIVNVNDGYARNFILPKKLGVEANNKNLNDLKLKKANDEKIAQEQLENVWDRYYKIDKNHKRAVMGTGLGLSIVKNILKQHDARYGVKSKPGQGSIFWFELKTIHHNEENR